MVGLSTEEVQQKLILRGQKSNGAMLLMLFCIGAGLGIWKYSLLALSAQLLVFLVHGFPRNSEKYYDLSGSATHLLVVVAALISDPTRSPRQLVMAIGSTVWMSRLGTFLYNRILRDGKDERFDHIKQHWLSWLGAWTCQATWVTLIQLPVVLMNDSHDTAPIGLVDIVCLLLWLVGFVCEAMADSEKMAFRSKPENRHKYITTGLWQYSRHPNYFGEILMWCSMALVASNAALEMGSPRLHAAWLSPLFTVILLFRVTGVNLVEAAGMKKWGQDPQYVHYMTRTSILVPWYPAPPLDETKSK